MHHLPRVLGALTAAYGLAVLVRPAVLAGPCGLAHENGTLDAGVSALSRVIGARDAASGLAMALAPTNKALRLAIAVRVAADAGDTVVFGSTLPGADARKKAAAVGVLWGGLCAASALTLRN